VRQPLHLPHHHCPVPAHQPGTPQQESFQAGYAAFEPALPQYSSSALPAAGGYGVPQVAGGAGSMGGGLPIGEGNKYDPKGADKFGDQAAGKVGGVGGGRSGLQ
jgi:hypothetical protein